MFRIATAVCAAAGFALFAANADAAPHGHGAHRGHGKADFKYEVRHDRGFHGEKLAHGYGRHPRHRGHGYHPYGPYRVRKVYPYPYYPRRAPVYPYPPYYGHGHRGGDGGLFIGTPGGLRFGIRF